MKRLDQLFDVSYGNKFDLNKMVIAARSAGGISFVGRSEKNLGVTATVAKIEGVEPYTPGLITVALGGTKLLCSHVQLFPFYTAQNVAVLVPKVSMTLEQLVYVCECIKANRFRYSAFGREANRTLRAVEIPDPHAAAPTWVTSASLEDQTQALASAKSSAPPVLPDPATWHEFRMGEVFDICKGYYNKKPPDGGAGIPFIGATAMNNGVTSYVSEADLKRYSKDGSINAAEPLDKKLFPGGAITISNNGSVGEAFYQPEPFTCTHDVNPVYLKDKSVALSAPLAFFLCTVIRADKYRWGYGRKWRPIRMPSSIIKLPALQVGGVWHPDWKAMEAYVNALPFSSQLA